MTKCLAEVYSKPFSCYSLDVDAAGASWKSLGNSRMHKSRAFFSMVAYVDGNEKRVTILLVYLFAKNVDTIVNKHPDSKGKVA